MNKKRIYNIFKPLGSSPLEALEKFRKKEKLPASLKMSYAGRLDPMAEGVLLIVAGDELKNKYKYLKLDKVYKAKILFGVSTDTQDLLGKVLKVANVDLAAKDIINQSKKLKGELHLPIPAFSSPSFKGDYLPARKGRTDVPNKLMITKSVRNIRTSKISSTSLLKYITKAIAKVKGDFRQKEILKLWKRKLQISNYKFQTVELEIACASGTYVRSLAEHLGKTLNSPAVLFSLQRTKVGKYTLGKTLKI